MRAQTDKLIFISYSRANRAFALEVRRKLTDLGFKLWRDIEDMPIGEKWWAAIQEAIRSCDFSSRCEGCRDRVGAVHPPVEHTV